MQKQGVIMIAVAALVIGHMSGYLIGKSNNVSKEGVHQMPISQMSMVDMMATMNAELEGKTGDDFDKSFLSEMIVHHEGAVGMAQIALTHAKHQEIKNLANAIISAQKKEIAEMKTWQKSWYNIENSTSTNSAEGAPVGSIHNMPVPAGVGAARKQLAQTLKIEESKVLIMTAYEKEWSDSCLGLGGPAESCLMAITPGYEVTMQAVGKTYVYRTNIAGTSVREAK